MDGDPVYHRTTEPGTVLYGNPGEKPHILKSDRPGNSFEVFVEKVLRGAGAVAGMSYELVRNGVGPQQPTVLTRIKSKKPPQSSLRSSISWSKLAL
ncbi:MAG: phage portal protein [Thermodesulfobacteriota bacterium]|nr:phage portal protein [Thermodesulfobacteriota bacterium]